MQHGDLATQNLPRIILVLEGVLCDVLPIIKTTPKRFLRPEKAEVTGHYMAWHDLPLKRLIYMGGWNNYAVEIVTFTSPEVADQAADYLDLAHVPYAAIRYARFEDFTQVLRYQADVVRVYDSDSDRLDQYGQIGASVLRGEDFS